MPGLRPLDLGEILDAAFRVFGRRWRTLVLAALAVAVPLNLVSTGLVLAFAPEQFDLDASENPLSRLTEPGQGGALAAVTGARLVDLVASGLAVAACLRVAAADYVGRDPGPGAALMFGLRRLPEVVGLLLMTGLGVAAGILLLVVPGVWLGTVWALALPALLFERTGVFGALGRSRGLVRGRFWPVLGLLALAFLLTIFGAGLLGALAGGFAAAGGADSETAGALAALVSGIGSMAVALPLASAMLLAMYVDQRVRGEGLTIGALARELGEPQDEPDHHPDPEQYPDHGRPAPPATGPAPELPGGWQPPRPGP
jgi:hypothetical protein